MKKNNCPFLYFVIIIVLFFTNCAQVGKPVEIEKTCSRQQAWALDYLNENVLRCQRIDDSVAFKTTAKLGVGKWGHSWNQNFKLGNEGEFFLPPDHHLRTGFRIAAIDSAGVQIKYEYRFDHRSFGKELISIDTGEIRLNYR